MPNKKTVYIPVETDNELIQALHDDFNLIFLADQEVEGGEK